MTRSSGSINHAQRSILARMAATRAELVATSHVSTVVSRSTSVARNRSIQQAPIFLQSPYAGVLAGLLVGSVILGPRHIIGTAVRVGLMPWITYTIKNLSRR
jgi:hypothetical protein